MSKKKNVAMAAAQAPLKPGNDPWQAREDAETLKRAEEIKADKARRVAAERELRKTSVAIEKALKASPAPAQAGGKRK